MEKNKYVHNLSELTSQKAETNARVFAESVSQNMGSARYLFQDLFIYGLASLAVVLSNTPTPRYLLCHTAGSVAVVASRNGIVYALPQPFPVIALCDNLSCQ